MHGNFCSGSVFPGSVWGHPACGFSLSLFTQLERRAASSTGVKAKGRCRHLTLAGCFGRKGHPKAHIFRETMSMFLQVLQFYQKSNDFAVLVGVWEKARNARISDVNEIKGHLSTMLYYLNFLGWDSIAINVWRDHTGKDWTLDSDSTSPESLICAAIDRLNKIDAINAAQHYGGAGLQDGVDYCNSFAWHRSKNISYADKCCLETIFAASICPKARVAQ